MVALVVTSKTTATQAQISTEGTDGPRMSFDLRLREGKSKPMPAVPDMPKMRGNLVNQQ